MVVLESPTNRRPRMAVTFGALARVRHEKETKRL
jgi:hypothetical protein